MEPIIIGIAGGTASGKTTIAEKLFNASTAYGTVLMIKHDDYYLDLSHLPLEERKKVNFDHPNSYDSNLLVSHLQSLRCGITINKPTYDFIEHNRAREIEAVHPATVIILEGIMIFAVPEILAELDIKIFVDTPDDIRFIRRLKRDITERGRSLESVINQYLSTVRPMHLQFVEPSKKFADLIVPEGGHNEVAIDILVTKISKLLKE
jgi:uridine kinase